MRPSCSVVHRVMLRVALPNLSYALLVKVPPLQCRRRPAVLQVIYRKRRTICDILSANAAKPVEASLRGEAESLPICP